MDRSALEKPATDPTPIFELYRGSCATELLVAGVAHLRVFEHLAKRRMSLQELGAALGIETRPAVVLTCALRAMGLIVGDSGAMSLSELAAEHLCEGGAFDVSDYLGLSAEAPGVVSMAQKLRTNQTAAAFVYRDDLDSRSMEDQATARRLTLALAGRARNVAPHLAAAEPLDDAELLVDLGGGTGIYAIAYLQQHPKLRAVVLDRPAVLEVAAEFAAHYGVADRLELVAGDMFTTPIPPADAVLLSNVLHDWDVPECRRLVGRAAAAVRPGGRVMIHDVFLHDALDGPLPLALYSAALFSITEGRAYSGAEYAGWLAEAGLRTSAVKPTLIHCGVLTGTKGS